MTPPSALEHGRALAQAHRDVRRARATRGRFFTLPAFGPALDTARKHFSATQPGDAVLRQSSEWFLDNYYIVRRVAQQVAHDLPRGFVRRLPQLTAGPDAGLPRVAVLARELVARHAAELDRATLLTFVDAYQQVTPLTIAELWALPTMLRSSVLLGLLAFFAELHVPTKVSKNRITPPPTTQSGAPLAPNSGVQRAIRALRLFAEIDWKVFFEKTSDVEKTLQQDETYTRMNFDTCDSYRKAVEELAWGASATEPNVARRAIQLAGSAVPDPRRGHVGFYLVGAGRHLLEAELGYRPTGVQRIRRLVTHVPTLAYLVPLIVLTAGPLVLGCWLAFKAGSDVSVVALVAALAAAPLWSAAAALVQRLFAALLPPGVLPRLDFSKGISADARTLVVIPTLLGRQDDVEGMLRQIELHYLANPDAMLGFALLTDSLDSLTMPTDHALVERTAQGIAALNGKYGSRTKGPFHLLHRQPRWNAAEDRFMGWERKRGKLEELNRLLRGDDGTSFVRHEGDPAGLKGIRFVITLDSDTALPMGSAHRLVGMLAHPLNVASIDESSGRVTDGYTIIQPRIEISPITTLATRFAHLFSGDAGFDIYTHACSELYQDLFGSGIYCGKGIYDVDAFARSVHGRVPVNTLASHDLFEGVHGRTAFASDLVFFEQYPSHYAAFSRRMHRWVRGDWQLLRWLLPHVPVSGKAVANPLSSIDRWKILDNLRRSLVGPCLCLLFVVGWTLLPVNVIVPTLLTLGLLLAPLLPALIAGRRRGETLARAALALVFLLHEATVVIDAIGRVLWRTLVTHRHLLQWTSAANTAQSLTGRSPRTLLWREMWLSPLIATIITALVAWAHPSALLAAGPILLAWIFAPALAHWVSSPPHAQREPLPSDERKKLRLLARRTWLFFETFVGPSDQWLPIDNYQETPHEQTAHRTSPTNIGLMMLSTLSAYDLGYLGLSDLSVRLRRAFDSVGKLAHYRGHLLNWYETQNLTPLLPQYVSTVDSGNFAGCLLALKKGCEEAASGDIARGQDWLGLTDSLDLLEEIVTQMASAADASQPGSPAQAAAASLHVVVARMRASLQDKQHQSMAAAYETALLAGAALSDLDAQLLTFLETGAYRHAGEHLHTLRSAIDRLHQHVREIQREMELLAPWLALKAESEGIDLTFPQRLRLDEVPAAARRLDAELDHWERTHGPEKAASIARLHQAFHSAEKNAAALREEFMSLAQRADDEAKQMDFGLLFDPERKLFHIGFNVTSDLIDPHYYDLLASEARLASYIAIVKGDVPEAHWYKLGRPLTRVAGAPGLLSWGGTMFEYLMPSLLMRSREGTLLQQSVRLAVKAQIAYGEKTHAPWGISEAAYAQLDGHQTYQYRSFGVPGLGFKRELQADVVVAPYASVLAVSLRPRAVLENLARLESMHMLGRYGFYEALDLNAERTAALDTEEPSVVRSYMAHHQGMLLVALDNYLNGQIMVDRFHADPAVSAGEMLLNEMVPTIVPREWSIDETAEPADSNEATLRPSNPWQPVATGEAQAFILGNGRLSSLLTDSGGGGLRWQGLALTRYQPDAACAGDGVWFHLRDEDTGKTWLATSDASRPTFSAHKAEFHQRHDGISVHVDIAVTPGDDVELRQVTLHNETDHPRRLTVTSASEPVLLPLVDANTHPAFGRLFLHSEHIAEIDGLVFSRRPRSEKDGQAALVHRLVRGSAAVTLSGYETDRREFIGRCGSATAPKSLADKRPIPRHQIGASIDPIMALTAATVIGPKESVTFAFVSAVSKTRDGAVAIATKYGAMHLVRWAFADAEKESPRRLARLGIDPELLPSIQRLFSTLLFALPTLRAPITVEQPAARAQKKALWGHGISGDLPILLLRVGDPGAMLLRDVVLAQRYLRSCGFAFDLVLMDEEPSGYMADGTGSLRRALASMETGPRINRRKGIYSLANDQIGLEERRRLEASARVVLDTRDGSLADCVARHEGKEAPLPRVSPTLPALPPSPATERPALRFDNGLGGFSEDGREYVISVSRGRPTPAPWCNVLANEQFGCLVSESALGSTWSLNAGENRLTPWRNDPVTDTPSEVLYLRDEETAAVWSSTPEPAGGDVETIVRHGAGYTTYSRESDGLQQELTVFVPPGAPLKVIRLRLKNKAARRRRITATYYAEWVLGSLREEQKEYVQAELDRPRACMLATCDWNAEFSGRVAFLAAERDLHGFTASRVEFLGYPGSYAAPAALQLWGLSGNLGSDGDPCAALQIHLELPAGEDEVVTHFVLGQAASKEEALRLVDQFRKRDAVDASWLALGAFWDGLLDKVRVKTPDPAMDLLLNRWLLYQTLSSRIFGRTAFYQSSGAFGFRDQLQDVLALTHAAPQRARAHILETAHHQFEEGDVLHWWHPPSGRGVRTRCSDDMVWLPFIVAAYVSATGDTAILSERVTYLAGAPLRADEHDRYAEYSPSTKDDTLLEHCRRALHRALTQGSHGLPLMGDSDWNDGMNRVGSEGRGESVWLAWFLCATMHHFAAACEAPKSQEVEDWNKRVEVLRASVEACAWDGGWYVRAFHDDGSVLGSASARECRIDSIAQSWAVLSGVADAARAHLAMQATSAQLVDEKNRLVLLLRPPFDNTIHDPGYIRAYPPGVRENGGQYTHAATWLGFAHAALGDGQSAERIFRLLSPILHSQTREDVERYRLEPYVVAGDVYGCSPWVGRGGWSWYTGSAAWTYRLGLEAILGLKKEAGRLVIDPCIPPEWKGFEAWIQSGTDEIHVVVENPKAVSRGVESVTIDGLVQDSNCIDVNDSATEPTRPREVRVLMGPERC